MTQDLDSAHGTWVDDSRRMAHVPQLGTRLDAHAEPTKLTDGMSFRLGTSRVVFRVVGAEPEEIGRWRPPRWAAAPTRKLVLEARVPA